MRIFVALDIDEAIRERLRTFVEGVRRFAPDARWVRPESLHATLKFVGEKPPHAVDAIKQALASVVVPPFEICLRGYGFFPTPKSPRVFWIGIQSEMALSALAAAVDDATAKLGVPREDHPFSPHLTLARRGSGSGAPRWHKGDAPNRTFHLLTAKLAAMPPLDFGTMTVREFFLYESQLSRDGSRYTQLAPFTLREDLPATNNDPHTS